jgi:hypothetical protein
MPSSVSLGVDFRNQRFSDALKGLNAVADSVHRSLDKAPQYISEELRSYLDSVAEALATRHGKAWPGGTSANTLSKRSGHLIEAISESVKVEGTTIATVSGTIAIPANRAIHEKGGVLKPKQAKYLTIPLPAALDSKGIPLKKSAKDWENTFIIKSKAGNLLIVQKQGIQLVPLYVLKTEVYIPPRLGMGKTLEAGQSYIVDRLAAAILRSLTETV